MRSGSAGTGRSKLDDVREKFENWRTSRRPGARIPERLWRFATEAAREHGVSRTSKELSIDYNLLKKRLEPEVAERRDTEFVEIPMGPAMSSVPESLIEIEDVKGARLRVELKGAATGELEALVRTILGAMR